MSITKTVRLLLKSRSCIFQGDFIVISVMHIFGGESFFEFSIPEIFSWNQLRRSSSQRDLRTAWILRDVYLLPGSLSFGNLRLLSIQGKHSAGAALNIAGGTAAARGLCAGTRITPLGTRVPLTPYTRPESSIEPVTPERETGKETWGATLALVGLPKRLLSTVFPPCARLLSGSREPRIWSIPNRMGSWLALDGAFGSLSSARSIIPSCAADYGGLKQTKSR